MTTYPPSEASEVFELLDAGLAVLEVRLLTVLCDELSRLNHNYGDPEPLWTNVVASLSLETLATRAKSTPHEVEAALRDLQARDYIQWTRSAWGEDERRGFYHSYKLRLPTDEDIIEQHQRVAESERVHQERLRALREKRQRERAAANGVGE